MIVSEPFKTESGVNWDGIDDDNKRSRKHKTIQVILMN